LKTSPSIVTLVYILDMWKK